MHLYSLCQTWSFWGGGGAPPVRHSVRLLFLYGALDGHPFVPSHVAPPPPPSPGGAEFFEAPKKILV